ncbi:MAG: hypothetical protein F4W90_12620 [Gammaproteobacteria bacterium]|nr:hypothetical protein [Gammaproteobacteria bacterium]
MRLAIVVYILLVSLVAFNVTQIFDVSSWIAALPVLVVIGILAFVQFKIESTQTLYFVLNLVGIASLLVVSVTAALPALATIDGGSTLQWTNSLIPLFVSAIGLYGVGVWLHAASANESDALDWLANFLSGPGLLLSLLTALVLSAGTLLAMGWLGETWTEWQTITRRFLDRGLIPPTTVLFFYWGTLILLGKSWNTLYLHYSMRRWEKEDEPQTVSHVDRIRVLSDDAGRLDDRLEYLWRRHEESFTVPRYIGWVVPVLGFIGTVLGISLAADGIRRLIASESGLSGLSDELGAAIAPLGIAFDTTLIALSLGALLMLLLNLAQRSEERALTTLERQLRESVRAF